MADSGRYDIVILGGGSGGYACALRAAELGMRVALVERDKVGGTCLHRGCIPTKALLHAAEIADHANDAEAFGVRARFEGIDMNGVNAYKDKVVDRLWKGLTSTLLSRKIDIVSGDGRLVSPNAVQVGDAILEGGHVVLATGSEPRSLPGLAIDGQRVITSDDALKLGRVPGSVVILGGGVIGVEFASVWRSFGAEVTIVEMLPHLLPAEDESSSKLLERAFRRRGISYQLGARFEGVKDTADGVTVTLEGGKTLDAELLLVAVGRSRFPRLPGGRGRHGARFRHGGLLLPDQRPDDLGGGRPDPGTAAGARRCFAERQSWSPSGWAGSTVTPIDQHDGSPDRRQRPRGRGPVRTTEALAGARGIGGVGR